jgi:hypothetical protein
MQLQNVTLADHEIAWHHDPIGFSFAPNAGVFEALNEVSMDFFRDI